MVERLLLYGSVAGFAWLTALTFYYAALRKRRAVVSMFASFVVAALVTVWTAGVVFVGVGVYDLLVGGVAWSFGLFVNVVVASYVLAVGQLTLFFVFNQWSVRRMVRRYRSLADEDLTYRLRQTVDIKTLVSEFDVGEVEILVVDDVEANAHTMVVARPSLFSPKLGKEVLVVKRPLVELLEPDEIQAVLAHELAHVEELDARFRPYFEVLQRLYFFDPFLRAIRDRIRRAQEYGADDRAAGATDQPAALAAALVKVAEYEREQGATRFEVKERAERLAGRAEDGQELGAGETG